MEKAIYTKLLKKKNHNEKSLAILIDPDKCNTKADLVKLIHLCVECNVDFLLFGGSLITSNRTFETIQTIKDNCQIPLIIFPGNFMHIVPEADAILFLSLISGRNPDLLIGQQVIAAPILKQNPQIEVISTGYLLIDAGAPTTALYMSQSMPIPQDKPEIAVSTALAAQYLGFSSIYLDAGSGAKIPVGKELIASVHSEIDLPIIVGGGLNSPEKVSDAFSSGADMVVLGNGIEKNPDLLIEVSTINKDNFI